MGAKTRTPRRNFVELAATLQPLNIRGATLRDRRLELGGRGAYDAISASTLQNCRLEFRTSSVTLVSVHFEDCAIHVKRVLRNRALCGNDFLRCSFTGRYIGCEWGPRLEFREYGASLVLDCDYSRARMHQCCLFDCDHRRQKWPPWPHVAFVELRENAARLRELERIPELASQYEMLAYDAYTYGLRTVVVLDMGTELSGAALDRARDFLTGKPYALISEPA